MSIEEDSVSHPGVKHSYNCDVSGSKRRSYGDDCYISRSSNSVVIDCTWFSSFLFYLCFIKSCFHLFVCVWFALLSHSLGLFIALSLASTALCCIL